jgi:hypothetical protein
MGKGCALSCERLVIGWLRVKVRYWEDRDEEERG